MLLIQLMQKAIVDTNAENHDLPCIYFMYIHQVCQHQINIKLYGQMDVDINLMSTVAITKTFTFDLWLMVS